VPARGERGPLRGIGSGPPGTFARHLPDLVGARRALCATSLTSTLAEPRTNVQTPQRTSCAHIPSSRRSRACAWLGWTSLAHSNAAAAQCRGERQQAGLAKRERALGQGCDRWRATSAAGSDGPTVLLRPVGSASLWARQAEPAGRAAALTASAPSGWRLRARRQRQNGAPSANAAAAQRDSHELACLDRKRPDDTMR
jgi:hypothetical protein